MESDTSISMADLGSIQAADLADTLGVSMKGLRLVMKNTAPALASALRPDVTITPSVLVDVLVEMGLAQKTPAERFIGVGGFSVVDFSKKTRGGVTGAPGEAVEKVVAPVILEKNAPAVSAVQVTLVNPYPNPLFWRAKLNGRMVVVKELNATKRSRFKPTIPLMVWPLQEPKDHFTTVAPK